MPITAGLRARRRKRPYLPLQRYGYLHDDMSRKLPSAGLLLSLCCAGSAEVDGLLCRESGNWEAAAAGEAKEAPEILVELERDIERRVEASVAQNRRLPLLELVRIFGLSGLEVDVLIACLAPELDRKYERISTGRPFSSPPPIRVRRSRAMPRAILPCEKRC